LISANVKSLAKYRFAIREFGATRNVGRQVEQRLVARNQMPILGSNEIRLDEVRALLDSEFVGRQRVFRQVSRCAAMRNHQRRFSINRRPCRCAHRYHPQDVEP
jgi:hypothetical protein